LKSMKMKQLALLALILAPFALLATAPASCAGGTTGELNFEVESATVGAIIYVELTELTEEADYSIEVEDSAVFNWTTGASETSRYVNFVVPDPGDDGAVKIELVDANITVIDTAYLQVGDVDDLIPTELVQAVFIALIGLFLFAAILIGIKSGVIKR